MAATVESPVPRAVVEHLVREGVYRRMGLGLPRSAQAPHALVVNVSARHCHLSPASVERLFGPGRTLTPLKPLYQEGAFAARETVTLIGPRSRVISNLRILGPCRDFDQVELAYTDAVALGFEVPVRLSGDIAGTPGCMLMGPNGYLELAQGVIRAAPHVHMHPDDAAWFGARHQDVMRMRVEGPLRMTFDRIVVRVAPTARLEVHIDTDEGNACGLRADTFCELLK